MKVTVDTNVLIRAVVQDDPAQARRAVTATPEDIVLLREIRDSLRK